MAQISWNPFDLRELSAHWTTTVIPQCEKVDQEVAALLFVTRPVLIMTGGVTLVYLETRYPFHRDRLMQHDLRQTVQNVLSRLMGTPVAIDVQMPAADTTTVKMVSRGRRNSGPKPPRPYTRGRITAIPTVYRGVQFRSKLEANTAQAFDTSGIRWQYEVEGYDLDGVWYLPDFWLPRLKTFVEVKGILDNKSEDKIIRLANVCEERGFMVLVLQDLRFHNVHGIPSIVADLAHSHYIESDGAVLVRCPECHEAIWKLKNGKACPLCTAVQATPQLFGRV